jgi:hypothetical protein
MANVNKLLAAFAALAIASAAPAAHAATLTPGTGPTAPDVLSFGFGALLNSISGTFRSDLGADDFSGDYAESVFKDPDNTFGAGDLTFYLTVSSSDFSGNNIDRITTSSFDGFQTDVGYLGHPFEVGVAPSTVDRNTAAIVGFNISVAPGADTDFLTIMTDAISYTTGNISLSSAKGARMVAGFAPAIPEPSTWAMMLIGFAGLGFAGYRGRKGVALA